MNALKEILDRVAELNVMFLAIDGKEKNGEKMGGIAWHGRKDTLRLFPKNSASLSPPRGTTWERM